MKVRETVPPPLATLYLLHHLLNRHITAAKADLMAASMHAPMYGVLQSISAVYQHSLPTDPAFSGSSLSITRELVGTCKILSELVSPVVCSSSPEGFLPDSEQGGLPGRMTSEGGDEGGDGGSSSGSAQSLLLCCWHSMKEVSLFFGYLVEHCDIVAAENDGGDGGKINVLTLEEVSV